MRTMLLTSAALFGLAFSLPACAQTANWPWAHQPGTGESGPASNTASNLAQGDARSSIAPHLPEPAQGRNAPPEAYLRDAARALASHQTGLAQQSLEMAETRLLDRSTLPAEADVPDQSPEIRHVSAALSALGRHDVAAARQAIQMALATAPGAMPGGPGMNGMAGPASYSPGSLATPPNSAYPPPPPPGSYPPSAQ